MLDLVTDDQFARIEALATRPNLFRIVGRTFTETWHSMFLGWLMDPKGSHGLKGYPLKKLLLAITNPTIQGTDINFDKIIRLASLGNLDTAKVYPNETYQQEYSCTAGRIDVFVQSIIHPKSWYPLNCFAHLIREVKSNIVILTLDDPILVGFEKRFSYRHRFNNHLMQVG